MDGNSSQWADFGGTAMMLWLLQRVLVMALIGGAFGFGIPFVRTTLRRLRLTARGVSSIDDLDGSQINQLLEVRFRALGYAIERTSTPGTWGDDLILEKFGVRTLVQTKKTDKDVAIQPLQDAATARGRCQCSNAMLVANAKFGLGAIDLAEAKSIEIWDRQRLTQEILAIKPSEIRSAISPSGALAA